MNKNLVLVLALMLLVVSVSDEAEAPITTNEIDFSKYIISQTEMPIYELITPDVNETYVEDMARSLTPIPEISADETEFGFVVNYLNLSFEIDKRDGSMWYADYDRLWNVALGIEVPTPENCRSTADAWLDEKGLLPTNAEFANIGSTNVSMYNMDAGSTLTKVLQYHVNYEFMVGEFPITGDTGQISVIIGEGGDMLGFNWKWRDIRPEPYTTASLVEYESAVDAYGIDASTIISHKLVYKADEEPGEPNLLYPMWEIEIEEENPPQDGSIFKIIQIDATLLDPEVEITSPNHGISVMPGTMLTFDCNPYFGTPPYTYTWSSDFDGSLSIAKSFSTNSLSEVLKKDTPVPHAISVRVRDSEGRGCSDCIAVTIETVDFGGNNTITLVALGGGVAVVAVASLLILRRKKGGFILFFLLMLFSAFMFIPVSSASTDLSQTRIFQPSAPTGAYDDGVKEIGIEWVGMSDLGSPLWNTEQNIEGFYNWMGTVGGYSREFNWGEWSAWEEDFKDAQFSGTDTEWIDAVDFVYYQDHGGPNGVSFTSQHDDGWLGCGHMRLGDGDLDTIVFDACSPLAWENKQGDNVYERWGDTLQGIHQICSFSTTSHNAKTRGTKFGLYLTGLLFLPPRTIMHAWFRACMETEGSSISAALFYGSKSSDPGNPQLDDPSNDHAYGFGYVCSDPTPGSFGWLVYVTSSC